MGRDAQHLVVAAGLVGHAEHSDGPAADQATGERGFLDHHERIQRIAVQAQGVLDEAVVVGVARRGEEHPVEPDPARLVVNLVLVPTTGRNLDGYIELHKYLLASRWCGLVWRMPRFGQTAGGTVVRG